MASQPAIEAQPLVSIGLPVYNGGDYLAQSIESLLGQSYRNIELVISDNASTDNTGAVCEEFARRDPRVRYTRLPVNIGGVRNHSTVVDLCRGEFFMWASGDDVWLPDYITECMGVLQADRSVVAAYMINTIMNETGQIVRTLPEGPNLSVDDAVQRFNHLTDIFIGIQPFYSVMRTAVLRKVRRLRLHPGFDRIVFAEIGLHGKLRRIPKALYLRREHEQQSVGAYPSLRSRYRWINPSRNARWVFPHFEYLWAFFVAAMRAGPGVRGRLRCMYVLLRWAYWHRRLLVGDLTGRS